MSSLLVILGLTTAGIAALDAARTATAEWRVEGELDVRLGLDTHHEGWHVDDLAAHTAKENISVGDSDDDDSESDDESSENDDDDAY